MPRRSRPGDYGMRLDRITTFTDGVFAVAITLLVLDLRLPEIPPERVSAELPGAIRDLLPRIFTYALSFAIIGIYWIVHHRAFTYIIRYDRALLRLNLLFLFCVSFIPFTTSLNGAYGTNRLAFLLYAVNLAATGIVMSALWTYATAHQRLVSDDLTPRAIRYVTLRGLVLPVSALVGIGISLVSPENANFGWLAAVPLFILIGRYYRREEVEEETVEDQ